MLPGPTTLIDFTRGWTVVTVQFDRIIGVTKGRNWQPGLAAIICAIVRHEVDVIVVQSLHHLGTSVDSLLETLAELNRHGVKLVVHDNADAVGDWRNVGCCRPSGRGRRAYRRENIVAGQLRARAAGVRFGRPPVPPSRLEKVRMALREGKGVRERRVPVAVSAAKRRGSRQKWSPSSR